MKGKRILLFIAVAIALGIATGITIATEKPQQMSGEVTTVFPETGILTIQDLAGKTVSLIAGPTVDLKTCPKGCLVTVEYDEKGIISSLSFPKPE